MKEATFCRLAEPKCAAPEAVEATASICALMSALRAKMPAGAEVKAATARGFGSASSCPDWEYEAVPHPGRWSTANIETIAAAPQLRLPEMQLAVCLTTSGLAADATATGLPPEAVTEIEDGSPAGADTFATLPLRAIDTPAKPTAAVCASISAQSDRVDRPMQVAAMAGPTGPQQAERFAAFAARPIDEHALPAAGAGEPVPAAVASEFVPLPLAGSETVGSTFIATAFAALPVTASNTFGAQALAQAERFAIAPALTAIIPLPFAAIEGTAHTPAAAGFATIHLPEASDISVQPAASAGRAATKVQAPACESLPLPEATAFATLRLAGAERTATAPGFATICALPSTSTERTASEAEAPPIAMLPDGIGSRSTGAPAAPAFAALSQPVVYAPAPAPAAAAVPVAAQPIAAPCEPAGFASAAPARALNFAAIPLRPADFSAAAQQSFEPLAVEARMSWPAAINELAGPPEPHAADVMPANALANEPFGSILSPIAGLSDFAAADVWLPPAPEAVPQPCGAAMASTSAQAAAPAPAAATAPYERIATETNPITVNPPMDAINATGTILTALAGPLSTLGSLAPCRPAPAATAPAAAHMTLALEEPSLPPLVEGPLEKWQPRPALHHPMEYFVQRGRPQPSRREEWQMPCITLRMSPAKLGAVPVAIDQLVKKGAQAETARKKTQQHWGTRSDFALWGKGLAAGIAVGAFLWVGSSALRSTASNDRPISMGNNATVALSSPVGKGNGGFVHKMREVISTRATIDVSSDFRSTKSFWDGARAELGKGWQRHPDGYTRTGALALFRPSLQLADYRMEFMAQIESKSMGWVFRAHDVSNYYAMKLSVVEPGLRPVMSMVRYTVVNGKRGHKIETPLQLMMHNNTPYRVAVEVRGNHFTTLVEGETVDTWIDDTLHAGGVGFFSESGERARLYWMRVTSNDDLLGRICAYLSGKQPIDGERSMTSENTANGQGRPRTEMPRVAWIDRRAWKAGPQYIQQIARG